MQVQLIFKAQFKNQLYLVDRRLIVENRGLKSGVGWKIQLEWKVMEISGN